VRGLGGRADMVSEKETKSSQQRHHACLCAVGQRPFSVRPSRSRHPARRSPQRHRPIHPSSPRCLSSRTRWRSHGRQQCTQYKILYDYFIFFTLIILQSPSTISVPARPSLSSPTTTYPHPPATRNRPRSPPSPQN